MNLLLLGPDRPEFIAYLKSIGDRVVQTADKLSQTPSCLDEVEFIISYGYIHKVPAEALARANFRAINLHISLLPWNRGNDPNLWSFLEDSPKGVTIHTMTERIDAGKILCQQEVHFENEKTLKATYERLHQEIVDLFKKNWLEIRAGRMTGYPQSSSGNYHRPFDRTPYESLLVNGWDTPVAALHRKAYPCVHQNNEPK